MILLIECEYAISLNYEAYIFPFDEARMLSKVIRLLYRVCVLVVCLLLLMLNVGLYLPAADAYGTGAIPGTIVSQLNFVGQALRGGAGEDMQGLFPEGYFFTHVLYGLSWVQVGLRAEGEMRAEAVREARWALEQLDSTGRRTFSPDLVPPYGVFYVGWKNWLRGGVLLLDPSDGETQRRFEEDCDALAAAFESSSTPFLTAYPGMAWPVDSVVGIAALSLHDHLLTPRYETIISRWLALAQERLDPVTRLLPHRVDPITGEGFETARGSSQSIILRFLPEIDPLWASEQYAAFRSQFVGFVGTVPGIREYLVGVAGEGDVDSGPLVNGLSASASVVTMGTAFLYGDRELGEAFFHIGESAGIPISWDDTKRYGFGLLPVGDAFLAWSQTALSLGARPTPNTFPTVVSSWWRVPLHLLSLGFVAVLLLPEWKRYRRRKAARLLSTTRSIA